MVGKEKSKINEGVTARKSPWANQANHLRKMSSRHCRNMWNFQRIYIFQILFQKAGGIPVRRTRMKEMKESTTEAWLRYRRCAKGHAWDRRELKPEVRTKPCGKTTSMTAETLA